MTIVAWCLEAGGFGEPFIHELAGVLGLQVHVLQCLDCWCESHSHSMPADLNAERLFSRVTAEALELAARGNVLIVGWSAAVLLLPLGNVIHVWVRAPLLQRAWNAARRFRGKSTSQPRRPRDFDLGLDAGPKTARDCRQDIAALVESRHSPDVSSLHAGEVGHSASSADRLEAAHDWQYARGCRVVVGVDEVPLSGTASQEAAIARIEKHLHGDQFPPPCNPLCHRTSD